MISHLAGKVMLKNICRVGKPKNFEVYIIKDEEEL